MFFSKLWTKLENALQNYFNGQEKQLNIYTSRNSWQGRCITVKVYKQDEEKNCNEICNHINLTQRQKTNTGERLEEKKGTQKGTSRPINKTKKKTKGMKYKKTTTCKWKGTWTQTINKRLNPDHDPFFTTNNEYTKIKKEQTWKHNWLSVTHGTHGTQGRHSNKT